MVISHKQKEDKQKQIIRAAAEVFAQKGFARTVMADIALQAGIGKGTTYEYFKSKEDLFFAVFEWISKEMAANATVNIAALGGTAGERLTALSESLMNSWVRLEGLFSLIMECRAASASSH